MSIINIKEINFVNINNFYILNGKNSMFLESSLIYEIYKKYIKNINIKPFRKVYLSRSHINSKYYEKNKEKVMQNGANYLNKLKEENPDKLKEYRRRSYEKVKNRQFIIYIQQFLFYPVSIQ